MTVRTLIVDDSPTMQAMIRRKLSADPGIEVVGTAANAEEARTQMKALDPDVVTLDVEMPGMNGLDFLERVMRLRPTPVVMLSSLTSEGAEISLTALELGAFGVTGSVGSRPGGRGGSHPSVARALRQSSAHSRHIVAQRLQWA